MSADTLSHVGLMDHCEQVLETHWGISASLHRLDGEFDLNLLATDAQGLQYLFKVMRPDCPVALVDMQCQALAQVQSRDPSVPVSMVLPSQAGNLFECIPDDQDRPRLMWVLHFIDGVLYSHFSPHGDALIQDLGRHVGLLQQVLDGFTHDHLKRSFAWNLLQAQWIRDHLDCVVVPARIERLREIVAEHARLRAVLAALPQVAIHNDVNDNNVVVQWSLDNVPVVAGLIDFGDMCSAPRVCDLAIAGAYVVLDEADAPRALTALVTGYHRVQPLTEQEVDLIVPLLLMRLAVSVVTSTRVARERPDDPYVVVSQAPAWRFLESGISEPLLRARLRVACGFPVVPAAPRVLDYLHRQRGSFYPMVESALADVPVLPLSVAQSTVPQDPFELSRVEAENMWQATGVIGLGCYDEPRLIYTDTAFRPGPWKASPWRTVHLGVDIFSPAGSVIRAALPGTVVALENRTGRLDYGGMVVLEHRTDDGDSFHTLYGHLDPEVCTRLSLGDVVQRGERIAVLGAEHDNGGWSTHLHLQLALSIDGLGSDWPGVADPDDRALWTALCPNPAALLNLPDAKIASQPVDQALVHEQRQHYFGANLKLSYHSPLMFLRGWRHYLIDQWGRCYLDAYNNVPHVGHARPEIQAAVATQLARLNTNTRYLHPVQAAFAEKIVATLPESLTVCYFVNSGSEANELALRLARAASGGRDMITANHGYHGNTTGAIDISAYKFNAPGGVGKPDWVQLVDMPDDYRGAFRRGEADVASGYAAQVSDAVQNIEQRGGKLAGFIAETFPSVGGQIIPPAGYLQAVYATVRAAGGICIADEVQTGLGRLGDHFYGFEQQGVVPDIVVLGKPIGNGHPLGVVITTREIADRFARGPEFFSTFGGSTLSCTIGKAVLEIVERDGLQENARLMGNRLLRGLQALQSQYASVGDVRGIGLFIGVDLVCDPVERTPASALAGYVVNRLRDHRVLTGLEGPDNNVLKIRPPLTIEADDVDMIIESLGSILSETLAQPDASRSHPMGRFSLTLTRPSQKLHQSRMSGMVK